MPGYLSHLLHRGAKAAFQMKRDLSVPDSGKIARLDLAPPARIPPHPFPGSEAPGQLGEPNVRRSDSDSNESSGVHAGDRSQEAMPVQPMPDFGSEESRDHEPSGSEPYGEIKNGTRNNGQSAVMKGIVAMLSEAEMEAIVDWLATLK